MAFSNTVTHEGVAGAKRMTFGTFTESASGTTGTILTGLQRVEMMLITPKGAVAATQCYVADALPSSYGGVGVGHTAGVDGYWLAIGV